MEAEYITAQKVPLKRFKTKTQYLAFYTKNQEFWMTGGLCGSEQDAIDNVKYMNDATMIKVIKVDLPFRAIPEHIESV